MQDQKLNIQTRRLAPGDIHPALWEMERSPKELWVQGQANSIKLLDEIPERGLSIVGTRNPSLRGSDHLKKTIRALKGLPFIIISGFARGMDRIAHELAIENEIPTIAILGAGLEVDYPKENADLRKKIIETGGLIVSEWPLKASPIAHQFILRNRIIATWAKATLITEAAEGSGAMNTARWARDHHRDVYAVPGFPTDLKLSGCNRLLDSGEAHPFWGIHSLGSTWPTLTGDFYLKRLSKAPPPLLYGSNDAFLMQLITHLNVQTFQKGGCDPVELLEWALSCGIQPQKYFETLTQAVNLELIEAQDQILKICDRKNQNLKKTENRV